MRPALRPCVGYTLNAHPLQGPLDATSGDFWRMVWQDRVPLVRPLDEHLGASAGTLQIVMLCDVVEKGKQKCAQYWPPEVGQSQKFGHFQVL